ncbi:helix-turn-helix transcriptional regulator [Pseudomonas sp. G.S.17]|uniref:AraC family transcriptional regulator n=1 Tax=Pseudomonas sp. G.S.17 TaxID=3137451 RepID=UPI00311CA9D5
MLIPIPYKYIDDEQGPVLLATARRDGEIRLTVPHRHRRGQLFGAMRGLLAVDAGRGRWVVPATHAVWVPPDIVHGMRSYGTYAGWSVHVATSACAALPSAPAILSVSGLLRESVARAATWGDAELDTAQSQLVSVILNEIATLPQTDLGLPMPRDRRLLQIAHALSDRPDDDRKLEEWAQWAGIAPRTLTRRFVAETGFSLTEWRQRVRLLRAIELLAAGRAVSAVALDLGYQNVSAFISLFKRTFAMTPGQYMDLMAEGSLRAE